MLADALRLDARERAEMTAALLASLGGRPTRTLELRGIRRSTFE